MAATGDMVQTFCDLKEKFVNCEKSGEWADEDYSSLTTFLGVTDLPKVVQLQSIELAATYAGHFPALGKQAFTQVMALQESGDASVKAMALKSLPGFLKPAIKTNEAGEKFNSNTLVSEGAPSLLQKKFEAADEASVKMATELLNKMIQADVQSVVVCCSEILQSESASSNTELREFILKYLTVDILQGHKAALAASQDAEITVKDEISKLLQVVGKVEFTELLTALTQLKIASDKDVFGKQGVVDTLATLVDPSTELDLSTHWQVERTLGIISSAVPHLGNGIVDKRFGMYLIEKCISNAEGFASATEDHRVQILMRLSEVLANLPEENLEAALVALFPVTLQVLPAQPEEGAAAPEIDFAVVECLLHSVIVLGKRVPEKFAELAGCKVKANAADAKSAAAASIKSKEEIEAEKAFKERIKFIHDRAAEVLLQLSQARQKLQQTAVSENRDALLAELRTSIPLLEHVTTMCRPLAEQYAHFPPTTPLSWRPRRNKGGKGGNNDKKPDNKDNKAKGNNGGKKGGKKGSAKGGKGGKGGKGRKGGKKH